MKKVLSSLMLCLSLSFVLAVPAFAETTTANTNATTQPGTTLNTNTYSPYANRTDGFFGPMTGTGVNGTNGMFGANGTNGTNGMFGANGTNGTNGMFGANGTNAFGTNGTGTYGAYDGTQMNRGTTNATTRANNTVRRMDTAPRRGFSWGWLGLLGLFGLAGMRSRNREDAR
ncbi:WGxxGxxG family protein [Paenibacillaceae bacterium WGS1546]|uniref:WGxxGxxG family protein n=1 Tax=Cohnella sp. WGS1546 TaxID=3366810 RepID=UPI00372CF6BE